MAFETREGLVERLQDLTHACLADLVPEEPMALVDFPDYRNVGDSAIWLGEIAYFTGRFGKTPSYVSGLKDFSPAALEKAVPSGPIFVHGGGNFGDIWEAHQRFRERVIELWPDRMIVQLPQSIHYKSTARVEQTARIIGKHKNFVLLVRDEESKDFAEKHFDCTVRLCPDMAFSIGLIEPFASQVPVFGLLRTDREKVDGVGQAMPSDVPVEDWITESAFHMRMVKTIASARAARISRHGQFIKLAKFNAAAQARLDRGVKQISHGRAVVTDRLHAHIVSLLLGRPHATLDNSYGKVGRFMAAFSGGTKLSYRAQSLDEAFDWAKGQGQNI